jgi:hypothetical protein
MESFVFPAGPADEMSMIGEVIQHGLEEASASPALSAMDTTTTGDLRNQIASVAEITSLANLDPAADEYGRTEESDAEAAVAVAPVSVDLRVTTPPHHHNAIETRATTAALVR